MFLIHFSKIALFLTAILPPVIWLAPLSKAIFKSASDFNPPPKSIFSFVFGYEPNIWHGSLNSFNPFSYNFNPFSQFGKSS